MSSNPEGMAVRRPLQGAAPIRVSASGFSLVELLVATMLLTLILGAVYTAFSTTARSWRVGEASMASYQGIRTAASLMTRELQCIVPGTEHLFEGGKDEVSFYAVTRPLNVEDGVAAKLLKIRYRLKDDPKSRNYILVREESPVEGPLPLKLHPEDDVDPRMVELGLESSFDLAKDIRGMELGYYWVPPEGEAQSALGPTFSKSTNLIEHEESEVGWGLPQGVRIRFRLVDPNSEEGESVFSTFVAFMGPTTVLDKKAADRLGGPL